MSSFKSVYKAHEILLGGHSLSMAWTMKAIVDDPDVSDEHKAIAMRSVNGHVSVERRLPISQRIFTALFRDTSN